MKKIFVFSIFVLLSSSVFSQQTNKPVPSKALVTAQLFVLEIEEEHKTILCGDGFSPIYWRFRVPDSKWNIVKTFLCVDDAVTLTYFGLDLSDPATIATSDEEDAFVNLPVLQSITVFKPTKLF